MKRPIEFKGSSGFQGPIIDWYNTLRNTTVCNLELHKVSSPRASRPSVVIVSLIDGSKYRLQRAILNDDSIFPEFLDTIEHILPSDINSRPLVRLDFNEGQRPDLLFILSVCYGARTQGVIFTAPKIVVDSDFFAVALILIVARKCLPPQVISYTSTRSPLETLWNDVYTLIQSQGYAFWVDTVAEYTKNMTRELIYRVARRATVQMPNPDADDHLGGTSDINSNNNQLLAAAVVARVEVLAEKKELVDPTVWDEAWDRCWREAWQRSKLTNSWNTSRLLRSIRSLSLQAPIPPIDGRALGRAAGRNPTKFPLLPHSTGAKWFHSISLTSYPPEGSMQTKGPMQIGKGKEVYIGDTRNANPPVETHQTEATRSSRAKISTHTKSSDNSAIWLARVYRSRRDDCEIWASPREIAVEMAWIAAWETSVDQGRVAAEEIQEKEKKNQPPNLGMREVVSRRRRKASTASRTSMHPGLAGAMTAAKVTGDWLAQTSRRWSTGWDWAIADASPQETSTTRPRPRPRPRSEIAYASSQPGGVTSPMSSPVSPRVSFPMFEVPNRQRAQSENTAKNALRKVVVSRHSDHRRRSDLEDLHVFRDTVRERRVREKKEDAQLTATNEMRSLVDKSRLPGEQLKQRADEAWKRAVQLSNNQKQGLVDQLAEEERPTISIGRGLISSRFTPRNSNPWKTQFREIWEQAWKDSWVAAWDAVWDHAYRTAAEKGVEFGVEEVLDRVPNASRSAYERLQLMSSYRAIEETINRADLDRMSRLEHVHSTMKELYSLYESLRHLIPNIRDDCMEIIVFTAKKGTGPGLVGGNIQEEPQNLTTYFQLQKWVEEHCIAPKFQGDWILREKLIRLFKRGISEVWDSASGVYKEGRSSLREGLND